MKNQKTGKTNTVLPADPNKAMQEMMERIDSLRGIYIRETDALMGTDTQAFLDLQKSKLEMAQQYQAGIEDILARKEQMKNVSPLMKKRLADMQAEFADLTSKNVEALSRMQRCTERLGATIMGAARESMKSQRSFAYGETGAIRNQEKKSVSMGVSETA